MAGLRPTRFEGRVAAILVNPDRRSGLESGRLNEVRCSFAGFEGEDHGGLTRPSCSRVLKQYPRGTEIRNTRQVSIVSVEELTEIATAMGLDGPLLPEWLGANLVIEGIPRLTALPPASRLIFDRGVSITVDVENGPCELPAEVIERHHPGYGDLFPRRAVGKRGVTGWIEREGVLGVGEACRLHVPDQRALHPAMQVAKGRAKAEA